MSPSYLHDCGMRIKKHGHMRAHNPRRAGGARGDLVGDVRGRGFGSDLA